VAPLPGLLGITSGAPSPAESEQNLTMVLPFADLAMLTGTR